MLASRADMARVRDAGREAAWLGGELTPLSPVCYLMRPNEKQR